LVRPALGFFAVADYDPARYDLSRSERREVVEPEPGLFTSIFAKLPGLDVLGLRHGGESGADTTLRILKALKVYRETPNISDEL
jgi:hypothetical protein